MYRLIIIDDDAAWLKKLCNMAQWQDYNFALSGVFSQSEEALEYIRSNHVDLVFTDITMPKYSGIDIARACFELKDPPYVVFISEQSDFEYARSAILYNVLDYMVKPFPDEDIERLLERVQGLLEEKHTSNLFATNLEMFEQQYVFSELALGSIKTVEELIEKLKSVNLPAFFAVNRCAHIKVTINNFDEYIKSSWKYGEDKLYNAIAHIAGGRTAIFSSSFAYVNNTFEILLIDIDSDFDSEVEKYIETLRSNLRQLFSITDISVRTDLRVALSDFITSPGHELTASCTDPIIKKSIEYIQQNYQNDITLDDVAKHISLSRAYFCSYFKKMTGDNFTNELNRYRIEVAKQILTSSDRIISAVAEDVGYKSVPYFYKTFTRFTGLTPSEYRTTPGKKMMTK